MNENNILKDRISKLKNVNVEVKATIAYTICNILQKSVTFITLPLFTRLLTTEQYGQYSVYSSWMGIISIFLTLNLAYGTFSTAMIKFEDKKSLYASAVNGISLVLSFLFFTIYFLFIDKWNQIFELPTYLMIVMIFDIFATNSYLIWSARMRFEFKYKCVVAVTLLITLLSPIVAYFFVIMSDEKGYARILGSALGSIVIGCCIFFYNCVKGGGIFDKEIWKYALTFNIPLIPYYLSQIIFNQSDRIMISKIEGTDKAGMYSVAYSLATIFIFVINSINNAYLPWFYKRLKEDNLSKNKYITVLIAFFIAVVLFIIVLFTPEIIYFFAGDQYMESIWVVAPVTISILLQYYTALFTNVEFYFERKWMLVFATMFAAVVNIVLNYIYIPKFGFVIAAYTTLISYILFCLLNGIAYKILIQTKNIKDNMFDYKSLLLILVGLIALCGLSSMFYDVILFRIMILIFVVLGIILFRKRIFVIYEEIKK